MWELVAAAAGGIGTLIAGALAARATRAAAVAQAHATRAAAAATAEPSQRAADLATFREIRDQLEDEVRELRTEQSRLRSLVLEFASYIGELTRIMHEHGVEPPEPPERVREYNRTGQ